MVVSPFLKQSDLFCSLLCAHIFSVTFALSGPLTLFRFRGEMAGSGKGRRVNEIQTV